jgi:dolichyl-phosphate-mannose-protein mannosyltransferase
MAATNQTFATGADRDAAELRRRTGLSAQNGAAVQQQQPIIDDKKKHQVRRALSLQLEAHTS